MRRTRAGWDLGCFFRCRRIVDSADLYRWDDMSSEAIDISARQYCGHSEWTGEPGKGRLVRKSTETRGSRLTVSRVELPLVSRPLGIRHGTASLLPPRTRSAGRVKKGYLPIIVECSALWDVSPSGV